MASILSHTAVPIGLTMIAGRRCVSTRLLVAAAVCSALPDADVIGFRFGVHYEDPLGHRGLTHSILFALYVGLAGALGHRGLRASPRAAFAMLTLATLSHGVLDAFTDGGLGVGFFIPFDLDRYFFPCRPIEVSPIGWATWSEAVSIARSELMAVWLPALMLGSLGWLCRRCLARLRAGRPTLDAAPARAFPRRWRLAVVTAMLALVLLVARELGAFELNLGRLEVDGSVRPKGSLVSSPLTWSCPIPPRLWVGTRPLWLLGDGVEETLLVAPRSAPVGPATIEGERAQVLIGFRDLRFHGLPWLPLVKKVQFDAVIDARLEIDDGREKRKRDFQVRVDIGVRALGLFPRHAVDQAIALRIGEILCQRARQEIDRLGGG